MASLDTSLVRRELKAIAAASKAVKKLLYDALERLENDPSQFPELSACPDDLRRKYPNATFRKVYLQHNPHNYRLIVVHWQLEEQQEHVDVLYAFPRQKGYPIDWDWVESILRSDDET